MAEENIQDKTPKDTTPPADNTNPPADELAEYRNEDGDFDVAKLKQLAQDKKYYRAQISKLKQLPDKIEDYGKNFVLDSKFNEFVEDEANKTKIDAIFEKIDKLSLDKGIGIDRNNDIRRFVLDELVENKVFDLTPAAEKKAREQQVIKERNEAVRKVIGEGSSINAWNDNLYEWLRDFCNSDAEYQMHKKLAETNSLWALSLNKVRQAQMGNHIPVIHSDPKFNQAEWDRAFSKATREEQDRMLQERAIELTKNK